MQWLSYLSGGLPGLILSAGSSAVFVYGGVRVIHGSISVGTFVAFMAYQMRFLPPLQALMGMYTNLATARVSLRRVSQILDEPVEVEESPAALPLPKVSGDISFEDVTLSFDRGTPVLEHLTFTARAGEVLAIVGPSGSGKSTIADLLLRLLDPDSGIVRIDGHDIRTVSLEDLRRQVACVDQEPCVLHASIADNLRYIKPDATDAELRDAAAKAALDTFIDNLPQGFETIVGERGMALSAGERQRLATARAFLASPTVLILDEPTASLDPIAERQIVCGYEAVMRDRTTIVITHRLDLAMRADRVAVLEGSRIVEEGAPADLYAAAGRFAALFHVQPNG
jgi:ATP-binding cassette subfamily B protein